MNSLKNNTLWTTSLFCSVILLTCNGCKPKPSDEIDNMDINIATSTVNEIKIDDESIALHDSIQRKKLSIGQHFLKLKDATLSFDIKEKEHVLINPSSDTVIMEEVLYKMVYNGTPMEGSHPYQTPTILFSIGNLKYAGPYQLLVNQPVIKGWDFGIGEKPSPGLDWDKPEFKGALHYNYYKLNSISEFRANKIPLNYTNEWIYPKILANLLHIEPGYKLSVQQANFLVVTSPDGSQISVCKVSTDNNDDIVLREVTWYNEGEHGKVKQRIAVIGNCLLADDKEIIKRKIEIVYSENTHQPHLRMVK